MRPERGAELQLQFDCWKLGRTLGMTFAELAVRAQPARRHNDALQSCDRLLRNLGLALPEVLWHPDGDPMGESWLFYVQQLSEQSPGAGLVLSQQLHVRVAPEAAAFYDLGLYTTLPLFTSLADDVPPAPPAQFQEIVRPYHERAERAALASGLPERLTSPYFQALRTCSRFSKIRDRVLALHDTVEYYFRDILDPPGEEEAISSQSDFESPWPTLEELPEPLRLTEEYLSRSSSETQEVEWLYFMMGGRADRTGLKVWLSPNESGPGCLKRLVIIVWVLPSSRDAQRFLTHFHSYLDENFTPVCNDLGVAEVSDLHGGPREVPLFGITIADYILLMRRANAVITVYASERRNAGGLGSELMRTLGSLVDRRLRAALGGARA
jgi:hypothetical protein